MKFHNNFDLVLIRPIFPFSRLGEETIVTKSCTEEVSTHNPNRSDVKLGKQDLNTVLILDANEIYVSFRVQIPSKHMMP